MALAPKLASLLKAHGVPVIDERVSPAMFRRRIAEQRAGDALDAPFYIADLGAAEKRFRLWQRLLPRVEPRYAVKCNPDEMLLGTLQALGCGFDAASEQEMRLALKAGARSDQIIFANPVKARSCVDYASKHGIKLTTFDSAAELEKLAKHWPDAQLVLRIATDDSGATCQLSNKYGAHLGEEVHSLILLARALRMNIVGVAFHCGSGQTQSVAFGQAVVDAAAVFEQLRDCGFNPHLLDIGGGFPGEDAVGSAPFAEIAASINAALSEHFPEDGKLQVIGEPGRFFAYSAFTLACNIIGKKQLRRSAAPAGESAVAAASAGTIACSYTISDGLYGSFNCLLYDHAVARPVPLRVDGDGHLADYVLTTVFGPTCDGMDNVCKEVLLPPDLSPGQDWLLFEGMGAYTLAAGSTFNGIQRATVHYTYSRSGADQLAPAEESAWAVRPQAVMAATSSTTANARPPPRPRL